MTVEERLQRLEDPQSRSGRLFMDYRRHLDRRDFPPRTHSSSPMTGEWLGNLGPATGPAEIESLLVRTLEGFTGARRPRISISSTTP